MFFVILTRPAADVGAVAQLLARELGGIAYEHRMKLARGVPTTLFQSAEKAAAQRLADELLARGDQAVLVDSSNLVRREQMVRIRGFRFESEALCRTTVDGSRDEPIDSTLRYDQLSTIVRAIAESTTRTTTAKDTRKFSAARAALSGGLVLTKTKKVEHTKTEHQAQQLLYLFPKSGVPWLLQEHGTNYRGLGKVLEPSSFRNLLHFVDVMRARAPGAVYDESLMGPAGAAARTGREDIDVLATAIFLGVDSNAPSGSECRASPDSSGGDGGRGRPG